MESIHWTTLEFEEKERHPDWIWTAGLVFALAAVLAFFYNDIFFGIFLILAGVVVIMYAVRAPRELNVVLNDKGISINDELVPYERIRQFWLDETGKQDKLLLLVTGSIVPIMAVMLDGVAADTIRQYLAPRLKEQELRESLSVKIFEHIGY